VAATVCLRTIADIYGFGLLVYSSVRSLQRPDMGRIGQPAHGEADVRAMHRRLTSAFGGKADIARPSLSLLARADEGVSMAVAVQQRSLGN
jgi:hypothetical protein